MPNPKLSRKSFRIHLQSILLKRYVASIFHSLSRHADILLPSFLEWQVHDLQKVARFIFFSLNYSLESTELSKTFAKQGLKIPIRNDGRLKLLVRRLFGTWDWQFPVVLVRARKSDWCICIYVQTTKNGLYYRLWWYGRRLEPRTRALVLVSFVWHPSRLYLSQAINQSCNLSIALEQKWYALKDTRDVAW